MRKRKNERIFNACFIAKLFKTFLSSGDLIYNSCFASMYVLSSVSMSLSKTRKIQRFNVWELFKGLQFNSTHKHVFSSTRFVIRITKLAQIVNKCCFKSVWSVTRGRCVYNVSEWQASLETWLRFTFFLRQEDSWLYHSAGDVFITIHHHATFPKLPHSHKKKKKIVQKVLCSVGYH